MWIPRPVYEAMPYVFAGAGSALIVIAVEVERAPHGLFMALGGALVTLGLVLWMKRRDYRTTQTEYDPHSLDK
jgi:hypothetical protein